MQNSDQDHCVCDVAVLFVCEHLKEYEPRLIRTHYYNIGIGEFSRMAGALIAMGALINKHTVEGGRLFERGAYLKEGAKSNHYGILFSVSNQFTKKLAKTGCAVHFF